jgi:hypothetical protein
VCNPSCERRIGFKIKSTNPFRMAVMPKAAFLEPNEVVELTIHRFDYHEADRNKEKLLIQSAFSKPMKNGLDFRSIVELWKHIRPGDIMETTVTLKMVDGAMEKKAAPILDKERRRKNKVEIEILPPALLWTDEPKNQKESASATKKASIVATPASTSSSSELSSDSDKPHSIHDGGRGIF